jgi:TetR/AcrR family transcriptional repressor of lmrAB and yxaGH operons
MPVHPAPANVVGTRDRLISAMLHALRTKGFHGVGLSQLLAHAQAPKGVLYHHFPGGKTELAIAAIDVVVDHITTALDALLARHDDPTLALTAWLAEAQKGLLGSGYEKGCPLATIALESSADDTLIRAAVAQGFAAIRETLRRGLVRSGISPDRAGSLATLIVSAYEGALIQARVAGNPKPLQDTSRTLLDIVRASLPVKQP